MNQRDSAPGEAADGVAELEDAAAALAAPISVKRVVEAQGRVECVHRAVVVAHTVVDMVVAAAITVVASAARPRAVPAVEPVAVGAVRAGGRAVLPAEG